MKMRRAVRLFLFVVLLSCLLFPAGTARAATKVQIVEYKCRVCDKLFYSFKGDKVGENELAKQAEQLAKLSQLAERGKRLEECRGGYKSHVLDKTREGEATMEFISKNLQRFFVVKDGGSLNGSLMEWECFICKKPFYSLNRENLNIKEWDEQQNYLFNLKGRPIYRCKDGYYGHVFKSLKESSFRSLELVIKVENVYWSK